MFGLPEPQGAPRPIQILKHQRGDFLTAKSQTRHQQGDGKVPTPDRRVSVEAG
jgi:hypothetical protein